MSTLQLIQGACARDVIVELRHKPVYALVDKSSTLAIERLTPKIQPLAQISGKDAVVSGQRVPLHQCFLPSPSGVRGRFFDEHNNEFHFERDGLLSDRLLLWRGRDLVARFTPLHNSFPSKSGQIVLEHPELCFEDEVPTALLDLIIVHFFLFLAERRVMTNESWQVIEVLGSKKLRICGTLRDGKP